MEDFFSSLVESQGCESRSAWGHFLALQRKPFCVGHREREAWRLGGVGRVRGRGERVLQAFQVWIQLSLKLAHSYPFFLWSNEPIFFGLCEFV